MLSRRLADQTTKKLVFQTASQQAKRTVPHSHRLKDKRPHKDLTGDGLYQAGDARRGVLHTAGSGHQPDRAQVCVPVTAGARSCLMGADRPRSLRPIKA